MLSECDVNSDGKLEKREMEVSKGYVFGTKLKTSAIEGVARTTHDMTKLNSIFGGEHQINNHDDGFIIRDAKRKIARAIGIDENISNNALRIYSDRKICSCLYCRKKKESLRLKINSLKT